MVSSSLASRPVLSSFAVESWMAVKARADSEFLAAWTPPAVSMPTKESEHAAHFDPGSVQQLILDVFGAAGPQALKVAKCESGYRPDAVNPANHRVRGVFQVDEGWADEWLKVTGVSYWDSWMVAETNIRFAFWLYTRSGWGPWACAA